jgi:hypothetical protein
LNGSIVELTGNNSGIAVASAAVFICSTVVQVNLTRNLCRDEIRRKR